jgi:hypothetical protein
MTEQTPSPLDLARRLALALTGSLSPRGPDGLRATSQLVGRRNVGNRAFPTFTLLSAASGVFCLEGQRTMRMGSTSTTSIHKNKELNA